MEGEVPLSKLFKNDISSKILSVLFAVLLWVILNPVKQVSFSIPLSAFNESALQDNGIILKNKNYPRYVTLTVKVRGNGAENVTAGDFNAVLDFSKVKSVYNNKVSINTPVYLGSEDITIVDMKPKEIALELGKIQSNPFNIQLKLEGKPKANYEIISRTITPESVSLEGLDSLINSVDAVKAFVDVNNLDRDLDGTRECKVYNKKGEEIPELSKNLTARIKLQVAKRVVLIPETKGIPAKNFIDSQNRVNPPNVLITGPYEMLAGIDSLKVDIVDIENSNKNLDLKSHIVLPNGVKLVNADKEVVVSITIEQLAQKDFTVLKDDIAFDNMEIDNSLKYEIQAESIALSLKGYRKDLENINVDSLKPGIDVKGLGEGIYKLPLKVQVKGNVKLLEEYSVDVKIEPR